MNESSRLRQMILQHWQEHRPRMVAELRERNQLENLLDSTEEATADLLYELVSAQKMQYQTAWEMATREWAFLPSADLPQSSGDSSRSLTPNHPATSA
jgi:hypothetical protein